MSSDPGILVTKDATGTARVFLPGSQVKQGDSLGRVEFIEDMGTGDLAVTWDGGVSCEPTWAEDVEWQV